MGNRVIQQKLLKIKRAREKRRGKFDRFGRRNYGKLEPISPLARPDVMREYIGTMAALTHLDENFIKTMGLNNPKNSIRKAILDIKHNIETAVPDTKWISLPSTKYQKNFIVWHHIHEATRSRGNEYFLFEHHILLGLVKLSVAFDSSASAIAAFRRGFVAWSQSYSYTVE